MLRSALRSARGAIARNAWDLFAVASLASMWVGLAMIWIPIAFVVSGAAGLVYVIRNAPPEPAVTDAAN